MIGSRLGSYEIREELGGGGMGRVYRAYQESLRREVAVKTLLPNLASNEDFVERFLREARAIANLEHPGIVTIYDVGESDGTYYFAMQYLRGKPLDVILDEKKVLPIDQALSITAQVASALGFAHSAGILHRDVKPGNILVEEDGRAVLTDFGIAWAISETRMTRVGTQLGSPQYMSPEQVEGRELDARTDLYSLGIAFYQMLTGEAPYSGDNAIAVAYQHLNAPIPSARAVNPKIPPAVDAIVRKMMGKRKEDRHASAAALLDELAQVGAAPLSGSGELSTLARAGSKRAPFIAIVLAGLALAVGGFLLPRFGGRAPDGGAAGEPAAAAADATPPAQTAVEAPATPAAVPTLVAPIAERIRITSEPAGARVALDGDPAGVTPLEVELTPGAQHAVSLELAGYEPAGRRFELADLTAEQRSGGGLHFPLRRAVPPGRIAIAASYAARVEVGGRAYSTADGPIRLAPGSYQLKISAPDVFYSDTRTVSVASDEAVEITLPAISEVTVAATPSNCKVSIDGREVGFVPARVPMTHGRHEIVFDWQGLGKTLSRTENVTARTERIFAAAPD